MKAFDDLKKTNKKQKSLRKTFVGWGVVLKGWGYLKDTLKTFDDLKKTNKQKTKQKCINAFWELKVYIF